MKKDSLDKNWYFWGTWNQIMLFTSPWLDFSKTEVFKLMGIEGLKGDMKILRGNYYYLNTDLEKVYEIVRFKLENDLEWFDSFFEICDKKTKDLFRYYKNKTSLESFIIFMVDYLGCSTLVEFVDFCMGRFLEDLCDKKNFSLPILLGQMKPPKKTEIMKYQ